MAMNELFVYGTLKRNEGNNDLLKDSQFLGEYQTDPRWGLIDFGPYPGMIPGDKAVKGEVYLVSDDVLEAIDLLEGVSVGLFNRHRIPLNNDDSDFCMNAWAYLYGDIVWAESDDLTSEWTMV